MLQPTSRAPLLMGDIRHPVAGLRLVAKAIVKTAERRGRKRLSEAPRPRRGRVHYGPCASGLSSA